MRLPGHVHKESVMSKGNKVQKEVKKPKQDKKVRR